jgi:ABC-type transport system involved in cytochrome c biogenesis permease subunit
VNIGSVRLLHGAALVLYVAASVLAARRGAPDGRARALLAVAGSGAALHAAGLAFWWHAVGHGPYMTPFEVLSSNAWCVAAGQLVLVWREPRLSRLDAVVYPAVALLVAVALAAGLHAAPLPVVMRSGWLVLHATSYKLAFAASVLATAASLFRAWQGRAGADDVIDERAHRWLGWTFVFWTIGMLLGSAWGFDVHGEFWTWDPVEIWSLGTWGLLGIALHVHRFYAPGARVQAALDCACFAVAAFTLFGSPYLGGSMHTGFFAE